MRERLCNKIFRRPKYNNRQGNYRQNGFIMEYVGPTKPDWSFRKPQIKIYSPKREFELLDKDKYKDLQRYMRY